MKDLTFKCDEGIVIFLTVAEKWQKDYTGLLTSVARAELQAANHDIYIGLHNVSITDGFSTTDFLDTDTIIVDFQKEYANLSERNYINGRYYFIDQHKNLYLIHENKPDTILFCSNIKNYSAELLALPIAKLEPDHKVDEIFEELFFQEVN